MSACAGALKIPIALVKMAKRDGCPAFDGSGRVRVVALIEWLFAESREESGINWGLKLDEYRAKREEIKLKTDQGKSLDSDEVREAVCSGVAMLFAEQERLFLTELPPALKGLDEVGIRARCDAAIEEMKVAVLKKLEPVTK